MIKNKKWFTLAELLVWITIIWILALWVSQINFNTISDKQRAETYLSKIKTSIETVKNNSLIWKWIWTDLIVPEKWKIDLKSWSGHLVTSYFSWTWINYSSYSYTPENNLYTIKSIECAKLDWTSDTVSETWSIVISWSKLSLNWCPDDSYKILRINSNYKQFENTFEINTVSWIIEDK